MRYMIRDAKHWFIVDEDETEDDEENSEEEKKAKIDASKEDSDNQSEDEENPENKESDESDEQSEENNQDEDFSDVAYQWKSEHDDKVRPSHEWMNNKIVFYRHNQDERPLMNGEYNFDAGDKGMNCRCHQVPLRASDIDLNAHYMVYNYEKTKKDGNKIGEATKVTGKQLLSLLRRHKQNKD